MDVELGQVRSTGGGAKEPRLVELVEARGMGAGGTRWFLVQQIGGDVLPFGRSRKAKTIGWPEDSIARAWPVVISR